MNMASKGITFIESPAKLDPVLNVGNILHILCLQGSLSFLFFNTPQTFLVFISLGLGLYLAPL